MADIAGIDVEVETRPAYNVRAWNTADSAGPQCSQHGRFCYLCHFYPRLSLGDGGAVETNDWVTKLKMSIRAWIDEGAERPTIVQNIDRIYREHIKDHISWENPNTNKTVEAPDWPINAIDTHLLYSSQFPETGEQTVDHIYTALIDQLNSELIDKSTGKIIESTRVQLVNTLGGGYIQWKGYRAKSKAAGKTPRKKK
jgi:hypothetical protein